MNTSKQQTIKDFIVNNRHAIFKALSEPESNKLTVAQREIAEKAKVDCEYSPSTNANTIWQTLARQYYKI